MAAHAHVHFFRSTYHRIEQPGQRPDGTAPPAARPTPLDAARDRVEAMLSTAHAEASWFSAALLAQASVGQVEAILARFRGALGNYESLEGAKGDYIAHFANGTDEILIHLDPDNKIDTVTFKLPKLVERAGVSAMRQLSFLKGSWACTLRGGSSNGTVQEVRYSFSSDGLWMTELSQSAGAKKKDWATQMWGYDVGASRLVAYQFAADGVHTKNVDGWIDGVFRSERDDNGAIVRLTPTGPQSMQWSIESADQSRLVRE